MWLFHKHQSNERDFIKSFYIKGFMKHWKVVQVKEAAPGFRERFKWKGFHSYPILLLSFIRWVLYLFNLLLIFPLFLHSLELIYHWLFHLISSINLLYIYNFPGGSDGKVSVYNAGDPSSIPGSGRSPGEGNGNPLQYYCLENPMDRGAW